MKTSIFKSICESAKRVMLGEAEAPTKNAIKGFNILPHYDAPNIVADLQVLDGKNNWKSVCTVKGERENVLAIAREWAKKTDRN